MKHARHRDPVTQEGFTPLENAILLRPDLSAGAKILYATLKHYAWKNGGFIPSQADLALALGVTEKTLRGHGRELRDANLLSAERKDPAKPLVYVLETPVKTTGSRQVKTTGRVRSKLPDDLASYSKDLREEETPKGVSKGPSVKTTDIKIVHEAWRVATGRKDKRYDKVLPERANMIAARLKEGYTVEELCRAVRAVRFDEWEGRTGPNTDLKYFLGSASKVDGWLERAEHAPERLLTTDERIERRTQKRAEREAEQNGRGEWAPGQEQAFQGALRGMSE